MAVSFIDFKEQFRGTAYEIDVAADEDKIRRILQLKDEKDVLILGHNYMRPLIYGLSDDEAKGDSLALSRHAAKAQPRAIWVDAIRVVSD